MLHAGGNLLQWAGHSTELTGRLIELLRIDIEELDTVYDKPSASLSGGPG